MTIKERKELLLKPTWSYHDVMAYCGVKKSKAFQIINFCKKELNGKVIFNDHAVKRDSILAFMQTDIERERYVIKQLEKEEQTP